MRHTRHVPDATTSGALALIIASFGFLGGTAVLGTLLAVLGLGSMLLA